MARAMERLAGGDLSVSGLRLKRRDEIGALSRAFAIFQSEKAENDDLTRAQAAARTRGEAERTAAMRTMADGFERAVSGIDGLAARIREIDGVASAIASAVEEQGVVTREIGRNVTRAARGTGAVTGPIAGVARAAEETAAAAGELLSAASGLSRFSEHLGGGVEIFRATVRAA